MTWRAIRFGVATVLGALVAASTIVAESSNLTATFLGNQAFRISDGETTLCTDFPYKSGAYGYMTWDETLLQQTANAYCLITHEHRDHFAAELVAELGCTVVGPPSVVAMLGEREHVVADAQPVTVGPITVVPLDTPHNVEHRSYRVEWGGTNLYFSGDTVDLESLQAQPDLDVAFLSPWLFETALRRDALPEAGRVLIYHHRTGEAVQNCGTCEADGGCASCTVPEQGQTFQLGSN